MSTLIRKTFPVPPLSCNCTILGDPKTKEAVVVDPGGDANRILKEVNELGLHNTFDPTYTCAFRSFFGFWNNSAGYQCNDLSP